jgi:hypothetical protein
MRRALFCLLLAGALANVAATARADGPNALHVGAEVRRMTREVCAQKAVEAMGDKEKFLFAEVSPDGNARGWNEKTAVLVLSMPTPNKESIAYVVIACGSDSAEAERVRNAVRTHIADGPHNPKSPLRYGPEGDKLPPRPVSLSWKGEQRPAVNLARHFEPVALLVLEKRGFGTNSSNKTLVFGGMADRAVAAFMSPTASAQQVQYNVVTVMQDEDTGKALADDLLKQLTNVLYEP